MSGWCGYQPLDYSRSAIRLLELLPLQHRSRCSSACRIHYTSLDEDPSFLALSYVWGRECDTTTISIDGRPFRITRNLSEAIAALGGREAVFIWIDAICINQQDDTEKGIQVQMMRSIYQRAKKVIFWLGKQEQYDKAAVRLMNIFVESHKIFSNLEPCRGKSLAELGLPSHDLGWLGWASLLSRPWFGRVWIVQEFLNATKSEFMTGDLRIRSDRLIWFASATSVCAAIGGIVAFYSVNVRNNRAILSRSFALSIDTRIRAIGAVDDIRIFDLWTRSQLLGATDPRDRVFALLSTQTEVGLDFIDYSKDVVTVYTEITVIALNIRHPWTDWHGINIYEIEKYSPPATSKERTSRFLACKTETSHTPSLPSWVPDWRPAAFMFIPLTRYFPGTAWFTHDYSHAFIRGKALLISGCIVDRPKIIVELTPPYAQMYRLYGFQRNPQDRSQLQSCAQRIVNWQILCYLLAQSYGTTLTKHKFLEDFSRSMAFNALPGRSTAADVKYIAGFQALHNKIARTTPEGARYCLAFSSPISAVDQAVAYESLVQALSAGRKFVITGKGDLAWVPKSTLLGDCICFLAGCAVPYVVRPVGKVFELVGDCYLHSAMKDGSITINMKPQLFEFR